ncbi:hypothetical protein F383_26782 [Gossypium arboreum]|uniref:Uncharacterized protein n=1 Tax=Gossypium arboreum TaxID=29729 RepID=A0A0B0PD04_GOSAR|nr:hypothetical protein F383_26782 [Gossypium arboreum]
MLMRGYHLLMSQAMNSTVVNDTTYCKVIYLTHQLSVPYLFELRLLLISKYTSHAYIVRHPLMI